MSQETIQIAKSISTEFATALKSQVSQLRDEFNSNLSLTAESVTSIRRIVDEFESKWLAVDSQIGHQKTLMEAQKSIFDVEIKSLKGLINDVLSKSVNQIVDDLKSEFGEKLRINDGLHEEFTKKLSDNERANIDRVKTVIDSFERKWANTDGAIADHAERFAKELTNIRKSIAESFNVDTVMNRILDEHGHLLKGPKGDAGDDGKSPNPAEVAKHILRDKNFADMVKPEPVDPVVVADTLMKRHGDELKGEPGKDADPVDVVEVVGELMLKHGEAIRGKPGRDADEKLVAEKLMADQKFIGLVKEVIHSEPWTVGVYREGSVVKHFTGREYIAMQDTTEEPGDSTHWKRIGTHGLRDTGGYKVDQQYEPGDFYHKDGSTFFFDGVNHRLFAAKPFTKAEFDKEFKRIQDTVVKYHELHTESQKSIGMIEDVLVQNKAVIEDQGQRIQSLEKDVVDLLLQPTEINDGSVPLRAYKGQYVEGNEYTRGDVVTSYGVAYVKQSAGNGGLGDKSTWAKMTGGVSRSGGSSNGSLVQSINSVAELPPASNGNVVQIGSEILTSDGINWFDKNGNVIVAQNSGGLKNVTLTNQQVDTANLAGIGLDFSYDNGLPRFNAIDVRATGKFVYVAPVGSDATSYADAQSAATPWATTRKVYDTASTGDGINISGGTYVGDGSSGYAGDTYHRLGKSDKSFAWFGNGQAVLQATTTSLALAQIVGLPNNGFMFADGLTFDASGINLQCVDNADMTTNVWTVTYQNCTFKDAVTYGAKLTALKAGTFTFDGCTISGSLMSDGIVGSAGTLAASTNTTVNIKNSAIDLSRAASVNGISQTVTGAITNAFTYNVLNNTINVAINATPGTAVGVNIQTPATTVSGNNITIASNDDNANSNYGIWHRSTASKTITDSLLASNDITFLSGTGYAISLGHTDGVTITGTIEKNTITGKFYADKTPHGIAVQKAGVGTVRYNKVSDVYAGILASITASGTVISENVTVDCYGVDLYAKGCVAATFNKNTCVVTGKNTRRLLGVISVDSQGGVNTIATTMSNNVVLVGTDDISKIGALVNITVNQPCTYSNNIYFVPDSVPDSTDLFWVGGAEGGRSGATGYSIDEWRAATSITNGTGTVTVTNERVIKLPLSTIQQMIANLGLL